MLQHVTGFSSLLQLDNLKYIYHISLPIRQLMGPWIASIFWLLWILLLWTYYRDICSGPCSSVLLSIYPEVELLGHVTVLFWRTTTLLSTVAAPIYIPCALLRVHKQFTVSTALPTLVIFCFFIMAILMGVKQTWLAFY